MTIVSVPIKEAYLPLRTIEEMGGEVVIKRLSKSQFINLAHSFPEFRMEREANGEVTIMTPVKGGSGIRENRLTVYVSIWCFKKKNGEVFSPSTGFNLPSGSIKSPDVAWISKAKMETIDIEKIEDQFIPLVPDFVGEIRSKSDSLKKLKEKMQETWIANGVQLAWLIDPYKENAYVYRANGSIEVIEDFNKKLSGENVLKDFELDLKEFRLLGK